MGAFLTGLFRGLGFLLRNKNTLRLIGLILSVLFTRQPGNDKKGDSKKEPPLSFKELGKEAGAKVKHHTIEPVKAVTQEIKEAVKHEYRIHSETEQAVAFMREQMQAAIHDYEAMGPKELASSKDEIAKHKVKKEQERLEFQKAWAGFTEEAKQRIRARGLVPDYFMEGLE